MLGLSVKVRVLRSGEKSHFSARSGVTEKSSLIFVKPSKMFKCVTSPIAAAGALVGSSPGGSSTMPIVTLSLAKAAPADAIKARTSVARKRGRGIERSEADGKPQHSTAGRKSVKHKSLLPGQGRRDPSATLRKNSEALSSRLVRRRDGRGV